MSSQSRVRRLIRADESADSSRRSRLAAFRRQWYVFVQLADQSLFNCLTSDLVATLLELRSLFGSRSLHRLLPLLPPLQAKGRAKPTVRTLSRSKERSPLILAVRNRWLTSLWHMRSIRDSSLRESLLFHGPEPVLIFSLRMISVAIIAAVRISQLWLQNMVINTARILVRAHARQLHRIRQYVFPVSKSNLQLSRRCSLLCSGAAYAVHCSSPDSLLTLSAVYVNALMGS